MTAIYKDAGRPVHERVADLLARMTPEEKFAQMHAYWLILDENGNHRERSDLSDEFAGVSEQAALSERLKLGVGQITGRWAPISLTRKPACARRTACSA
jgi:beta-glucosidase